MRLLRLIFGAVAACLTLTLLPQLARGQTDGFPTISDRQYTAGSVKVTVTGSAEIDQEIPLNTQASISSGGMTWLQFGASGAEEPNALITYSDIPEIGISVGRGKFIVTGGIMPGEKSQCSGKAEVTATEITGDYTCAGVTSHDPGSGMGKVDVKVHFTAKS